MLIHVSRMGPRTQSCIYSMGYASYGFSMFLLQAMKEVPQRPEIVFIQVTYYQHALNSIPQSHLQGSFRLCNWLSLRRLVSWINHLPPAFWSTFRESIFKQQLGCRFDIMNSISYFLYFDICNCICLDTSYHLFALCLLLKYSLFFQVPVYKHLL